MVINKGNFFESPALAPIGVGSNQFSILMFWNVIPFYDFCTGTSIDCIQRQTQTETDRNLARLVSCVG